MGTCLCLWTRLRDSTRRWRVQLSGDWDAVWTVGSVPASGSAALGPDLSEPSVSSVLVWKLVVLPHEVPYLGAWWECEQARLSEQSGALLNSRDGPGVVTSRCWCPDGTTVFLWSSGFNICCDFILLDTLRQHVISCELIFYSVWVSVSSPARK